MNYDYKKLRPFKWFVLQNFPFIETDFDAITNWQLFCKLGEEINRVINSMNLTGEQVESLTNAFNDLQNYVNNYFENLDIQEEIDNKLDEMAEGGELADIIAQYLELSGILAFDNIEGLKNADNLVNGSFAYTYGTINYNDGLGLFYKIRNIINTDVIDNINIVGLNNFPTLVAELIPNRNLRYYKVKLTDSFEIIQKYFNDKIAKVIEFEKGTYTFNTAFRLTGNTKILLNNSNLIFNIPKVTENWEDSHGFYNFKRDDEFLEYNGNGNIEVIGGTITHGNFSFCHAKNITFKNINFDLCNNDHILEMCAINGLLVENCIFNGQCISETNYKEMIQLDNATVGNFPFFDSEENITYDNTTTKNVVIKHNVFKKPNVSGYTFDCGIGMHSFVDNYYHENIEISNNIFEDTNNMSIQLYNAINVNIHDNQFITNNSNTITNEGSHIVTRNAIENINIYNNNFIGNSRAFYNGMPYNLDSNKNINIYNNNFKNYINSLLNHSIIDIFSCNYTNISNNNFIDFNSGIIRLNGSNQTPNNISIIKNNIFVSNNEILQGNSVIKVYDGKSFIINNEFNIQSAYETERCIVLSADSDVATIHGNKYNDYMMINNRTVEFTSYTKDRKNIENIKMIWEGNSTSLSNISTSNDYRNYNHLIITLGTGAETFSFLISSWNLYQLYIDSRSICLPVGNGKVYLQLNQDGTFGYDSKNTNVPIRVLKGVNNLSI